VEQEKIKRFLIVSEKEESNAFFKILLREKQVQDITQCFRATEAVEMLDLKRIQFVIVEREMETMSGSVLLQRIRSLRQFAYVPILLFSSSLSEESIRLAKELGKDILKVPLVKELVWPVIKGICEREEAIDPFELEMRKAELNVIDRQFSPALEVIKIATKNHPQTARSQAISGEAWFGLGDMEKAEKALNSAIKEKQNFYPAMQLLARIYSRTGRQTEAIQLLSSMSEAAPENIRTLLNLGAAYSEADRLDKAREVLTRVRNLDPGNKEAALELGKIAFREGAEAEAEAYLSEAEDGAELGRFFNNLAIGMVNNGQLDVGVRTYEAAMRILKRRAPENLIYLQYNLGIAVKKKGDLNLAFSLLTVCCMARPSYDRAYSSLIGVVKEMQAKGMEFDRELIHRITEARKSVA
jgi:tetratricopeptide (TPR) repeat protein